MSNERSDRNDRKCFFGWEEGVFGRGDFFLVRDEEKDVIKKMFFLF